METKVVRVPTEVAIWWRNYKRKQRISDSIKLRKVLKRSLSNFKRCKK